MAYWNTSVNELMTIFKGSLLSVIPWLEKARIQCANTEAYDDWDNISTSLFENIVCSSIYSEIASKYNMPKYDMSFIDYSKLDFIKVDIVNENNQLLAFMSFHSVTSPLDSVKVALLDTEYQLIDHLILEDLNIQYSFAKHNNNELSLSNNIEVRL